MFLSPAFPKPYLLVFEETPITSCVPILPLLLSSDLNFTASAGGLGTRRPVYPDLLMCGICYRLLHADFTTGGPSHVPTSNWPDSSHILLFSYCSKCFLVQSLCGVPVWPGGRQDCDDYEKLDDHEITSGRHCWPKAPDYFSYGGKCVCAQPLRWAPAWPGERQNCSYYGKQYDHGIILEKMFGPKSHDNFSYGGQLFCAQPLRWAPVWPGGRQECEYYEKQYE